MKKIKIRWIKISVLSIVMLIAILFIIGKKNERIDNDRNISSKLLQDETIKQVVSVSAEETTIEETTIEETTIEETIKEETIIETITQQETIETTVLETEEINFVSYLQLSKTVPQIIVVSANGNSAIVSMHNKSDNGVWKEVLNTSGFVGENGVGIASEYDTKTPAGIYSLSFAFGIKENPGTAFSYTKVNESHYWVDDVNSIYYNQFVSTNSIAKDWNSAEHLNDCIGDYNYVIPINYNTNRVKGAGSAMFLHVSSGNPTEGCVSVSESAMIFILKNIKMGCVILIDNTENIKNY